MKKYSSKKLYKNGEIQKWRIWRIDENTDPIKFIKKKKFHLELVVLSICNSLYCLITLMNVGQIVIPASSRWRHNSKN